MLNLDRLLILPYFLSFYTRRAKLIDGISQSSPALWGGAYLALALVCSMGNAAHAAAPTAKHAAKHSAKAKSTPAPVTGTGSSETGLPSFTSLPAPSLLLPGESQPLDLPTAPKAGDYIVAVVNQDPITYSEVEQRLARLLQTNSEQAKSADIAELRKQILDSLIEERVQLYRAKELGMRIDDVELDMAIQSIAEQNQMAVSDFFNRLKNENIDIKRFKEALQDRLLLDRLREREVPPRIRLTEIEVDKYIRDNLGQSSNERELQVAQILIKTPDGATPQKIKEQQELAKKVLAQALRGDDFIKLAQDHSDDTASRDQGGNLGWRGTSQLPDIFVRAITTIKPGDIVPSIVRSDAGFHILKLIDRRDAVKEFSVIQSHARHILLRPASAMDMPKARSKLQDLRQQIANGQASFAQLARQHSQDGTATRGGDLGWSATGMFVPEFQKALDQLQPGQLSEPVVTRFGIHLIQLLERKEVPIEPKQLRENARTLLREQRFESAYNEWVNELKAQAYIEFREAPSRD